MVITSIGVAPIKVLTKMPRIINIKATLVGTKNVESLAPTSVKV